MNNDSFYRKEGIKLYKVNPRTMWKVFKKGYYAKYTSYAHTILSTFKKSPKRVLKPQSTRLQKTGVFEMIADQIVSQCPPESREQP